MKKLEGFTLNHPFVKNPKRFLKRGTYIFLILVILGILLYILLYKTSSSWGAPIMAIMFFFATIIFLIYELILYKYLKKKDVKSANKLSFKFQAYTAILAGILTTSGYIIGIIDKGYFSSVDILGSFVGIVLLVYGIYYLKKKDN